MMLLDRRALAQFDWLLFGAIFLVVLYSAGHDAEGGPVQLSWLPFLIHSKPFAKQLLFLFAGLPVMLLALSIPLQWIAAAAYPGYAVSFVALVAVLFIGTSSHGAVRWFDLGPIHFQPAELMKLFMIITLARYLSRNPPPEGGYRLPQLAIPFLLFGVPMALVMRQPDLGTALAIGAIGAGMLLFMGIRPLTLSMMIGAGGAAIFPAWLFLLKSYQKRRIFALFNPDADPLGSGYHIIQSKIAVGSGSLMGKGFMQGTQTQLEFLPEHTTDFIFSVLAEEWGFIGCVVVLCAYLLLLYLMLRVAGRSKDLFASLLVVGITLLLFFHVVVNMGMVVGILPVVGIPLPLFSYGGSAVLVTMLLLGVALGVAMRRSTFMPRF